MSREGRLAEEVIMDRMFIGAAATGGAAVDPTATEVKRMHMRAMRWMPGFAGRA